LRYNLTNEGGAFGTHRLLGNVMGLWLLEESRKIWARKGKATDYEAILGAAEDAEPFAAWIDPDDSSFINPPNMLEAIAAFCRRTAQSPPESIAAVTRCILESLALKFRLRIEQIEEVVGRRLDPIHIVGGGSRNALLCRMTAEACARPVVAGPVEATAMGNLLVQACAIGALAGLEEVRQVVRNSSEIKVFDPAASDRWEQPFRRFASAVKATTNLE
jgi:rhamnulokinase